MKLNAAAAALGAALGLWAFYRAVMRGLPLWAF